MSQSKLAISIDDVNGAHERIREQVRRTPCLRARFFREAPGGGHFALNLKLEQSFIDTIRLLMSLVGTLKPGLAGYMKQVGEHQWQLQKVVTE